MDSETIRLERVRYAALEILPKDMLLDFGFDAADFIKNRVAVRVERSVYGHRLAEWDQETIVPTNWWQHLMRTIGLPHKTRTIRSRVTRRRIYPDIAVVPGTNSFIVEDLA